VRASDERCALDLVIANAGISAGTGFAGESSEQSRRIMATNVEGAFNTVLPIMPAMVARGRGQIAMMSSLAGFRGFPGAPAYCASKATLRLWGEGQRVWLHQHGVKLSVICPGFIRTPMSDGNPYPMPFLMDADRAARIIQRGLARDKARIAFPWQTYWLAQLAALLPVAVTDMLLARTPNKPSDDG
jgi:short-subunit dehydrogenase